MEATDTNIVETTYTYGNDLITADFTDFRGYYHYDALGTVKQMTNDSGTIVANYVYDSFGNSVASASSVANSYGFTGQQQFAEADNLVFLRARYYSSQVSRFMSRDPLGTLPDTKIQNWFRPLKRYAHGTNIYSYVRNNVVNLKDPKGLDAPGCDLIYDGFESPCMLDCCDRHDKCYARNGCTMNSWVGCDGRHWYPWPTSAACVLCNVEVVLCIYSCGPALIVW